MNKVRNRRISRRRGGVLLIAVIATGMVAALVACMLQLSGATLRRESGARDTKRAFYLAEAGLAEAYSGLMIGKTGNVGSAAKPAAMGEGLFWVEAITPDSKHVQLRSTGMCGIGSAVLSLVAERGEDSVASLGVFAHKPLAIPPGVHVGGYDSSSGVAPIALPIVAPKPPDVAALPLEARVGSNDAITVSGTKLEPTSIYADLSPGPQHSATLTRDVVHVGTNESRPALATLPSITPPFQPTKPGIEHKNRNLLVIPSGDVEMDFLKVMSGAQVVVEGPCSLVLNDLTVANGGLLQFDTLLGAVSLWVLNGADLASGSAVSTTGEDPSQMILQAPSQSTLQLLSTGNFYGVVYAPKGTVSVGPDFRLYGALVADQLSLTAGVKLTFDRHLDDLSKELALPKLVSWRIIELGSAAKNGESRDPFERLGVDRESLPMPALAHADQPVQIAYTNLAGTTLTYTGMESAFNWSNVKSIGELQRDGETVIDVTPEVTKPAPAEPTTAIMDALNGSPPLSQGDLMKLLILSAPLSSAETLAAINYQPAFSTGDMKDVLLASSPLGSTELMAMFDRVTAMGARDQRAVLEASSPLPPDVLARVISGPTALSAGDTSNVLSKQ